MRYIQTVMKSVKSVSIIKKSGENMEKDKYYHYILVSYDDIDCDETYWYRTDNNEIKRGIKYLLIEQEIVY